MLFVRLIRRMISSKPSTHIRFVLFSSSDVFQVKQLLFNVDGFKTIRVSADKTVQQCKLYSSVAFESKLRKNAGETDLFIKFFNNCPIIKKKKTM